jgi:hypothetical protein
MRKRITPDIYLNRYLKKNNLSKQHYSNWYLKSKGLSEKEEPHYRPLPGGTYGAASKCKKLSPDEIARIENELRDQGRL